MTFKHFWQRELHVAVHAQSNMFRIKKYAVVAVVFAIAYFFSGWGGATILLLTLTLVAIALHFILRWKTDAWTKSWGPYKRIPLPSE
jgi:ABC-type transport system involved in cytochrome bd biosynthesis fused ATPase/permease subunit